MDSRTRAFMEPRFGRDFSDVRVHTDDRAAESARAVSARAYTVGRDIVFARGQFAPETDPGRRLLGHELAHVVQQGAPRAHGDLAIGAADSVHEAHADAAAEAVMSGSQIAPALPAPPAVQRDPPDGGAPDGGAPDAGAPDAGPPAPAPPPAPSAPAAAPWPTNADEQLLVGLIFAEASTTGNATEKLCIGQCAENMAYYATYKPTNVKKCYNQSFGDGTVLGAIKSGFPASYQSPRWNLVMKVDKLKSEADVKAALSTSPGDQAHFDGGRVGAAAAVAGTAPQSDAASKRVPIQFNQAADTPPSSREEKIAKYGPHTFYGFKAGRECG